MHAPPARTVAVIDDDRRVLCSLGNLLASGGYRTQLYESGEAFFAACQSDLICVITDLGMRPVNGLRVLERLSQSEKPVPVIIITGKPGEHSEDYYLKKGAIGFFRKPLDGDALLELLDAVA
jgi:FixJ family two-component response regulator